MSGPRPGLARAGSNIAAATKIIVLVTGGNSGIGYEIVKSLALSQPNYQILMGCRDTSKGEAAVSSMGAPANVNPIQLDITDDTSIEHCYLTIEQMFGRLDVLINNAGTAGIDLQREGLNPTRRETWNHVVNINLTSTGVLTERMVPLLQNSKLPKIIFITSSLGSIGKIVNNGKLVQADFPFYGASKAGVNMLAVHYAHQYPKFKVNTCCPGHRATGLNGMEKTSENDPALGAVNAVRLATEGPDGATSTFTDSEGAIPW